MVGKGLRHFTKFLVLCTLILIFAGSLVTSTGTGLSVPDWPTTYGHFMFSFPLSDMVGGIFYEHGHRLIASTVGFLTVVLTVWIRWRERRKFVRRLSFVALVLVICQGLLGGLTVKYFLPAPVSVLHAVMAQSYLLVVLWLAYAYSQEYLQLRQATGLLPKTKRAIGLCVAVLYLQLILGAIMRHTESGLAVPDFPLMGGQFFPWINPAMLDHINDWRFREDLPPVKSYQVFFHLLHRVGAVLVLVMVGRVFVQMRRHPAIKLRFHASMLGFMVLMQVLLGIVTVLSHKYFIVASLHVLLGAMTLAASFLLALRTNTGHEGVA